MPKREYEKLFEELEPNENDPMQMACQPDEKTGRIVCAAKKFEKINGKPYVKKAAFTVKEKEDGRYDVYDEFGNNDLQEEMSEKLKKRLRTE